MRIAVIADEGEGKSLGIVVFGIALHYYLNVPLASTTPLNGVSYKFIDSYKKLLEFSSGILLFDEMWLQVDSREPNRNKAMSIWVKQTRKRHLMIFYSVQALDQIDKRVKNSTKFLMYCEKINGRFRYSFFKFRTMTFIKSFWINNPSDFYSFYDTDFVCDVFPDLDGG